MPTQDGDFVTAEGLVKTLEEVGGGGIVVDRLGGAGTYDLSDYELVLLSGVASTTNIQGLVVRQDPSREVDFYIGTSSSNRYFRLQGTWDHMSITTSLSSPAFFGIK